MRKVVRCSCGVEVRAEDERELIERVQAHAREAHGVSISDEQVLAMAEIDEEDDDRPKPRPGQMPLLEGEAPPYDNEAT